MRKTISGIRGVFGKDMGLVDVMEYTRNFSSLIGSGRCVIASDTRPSGRMAKEAAKAALMGSGIDVFDLGVAPTPVVFREAREYGAGLVVSSSHNPVEWNGLKFVLDGRGITEDELPRILEDQSVSPQKMGTESEATSSYVQDAQKVIGTADSSPEIVADIGGGAARDVAPLLLENIGCRVTAINQNLADCSRGPDPTSDGLAELRAASRGRTGFAFDLDGDRLVLVVDGTIQSPDVTLGLGIARSLELGCKSFVLSIDTSTAVEEIIREGGGTVKRSKVGEANVTDMMLRTGAHAGGEGSSGGFILPEFNHCRDGILGGGLIATMLGSPDFERILGRMKSYVQVRHKIEAGSELHDDIMRTLESGFEKRFSEVITLDGLKAISEQNSWVLVRKSNTENAIRISAESRDAEGCKKMAQDVAKMVDEAHEKAR